MTPSSDDDAAKVPDPRTAEGLKAAVRIYCDANLPGWTCASVPVRVGEVRDATGETLLVLPTRPAAAPLPPGRSADTPG